MRDLWHRQEQPGRLILTDWRQCASWLESALNLPASKQHWGGSHSEEPSWQLWAARLQFIIMLWPIPANVCHEVSVCAQCDWKSRGLCPGDPDWGLLRGERLVFLHWWPLVQSGARSETAPAGQVYPPGLILGSRHPWQWIRAYIPHHATEIFRRSLRPRHPAEIGIFPVTGNGIESLE